MKPYFYILFTYLFFTSNIQACNCKTETTLEQRLEHFEKVFFARLIKIDRPIDRSQNPHDLELTLQVTEVMKGFPEELITARGYSTTWREPYRPPTEVCRYSYHIGQEYLIYKNKEEPIYIGNCSLAERVIPAHSYPSFEGILRIHPNPVDPRPPVYWYPQ